MKGGKLYNPEKQAEVDETAQAIEAQRREEDAIADIKSAAKVLHEPLSRTDISSILSMMYDHDLDADTATDEYFERRAFQDGEDIVRTTDDDGYEIPFEIADEPAGSDQETGSRGQRPESERRVAGESEGQRAPAEEAGGAGRAESGRPEGDAAGVEELAERFRALGDDPDAWDDLRIQLINENPGRAADVLDAMGLAGDRPSTPEDKAKTEELERVWGQQARAVLDAVRRGGSFTIPNGIRPMIVNRPDVIAVRGNRLVLTGRRRDNMLMPSEYAGYLAQASRTAKWKAAEPTSQGEQGVIPGAEKISDKELAERQMQGRKTATKPQQDADEGLFDTGARDQKELFSLPKVPPPPETVPDRLENIRRGREAMESLLRARDPDAVPQWNAMHRNGVGWISFVWDVDRLGVSHIMEGRADRGKNAGYGNQRLTGKALTDFMKSIPDIIGGGTMGRWYREGSQISRNIYSGKGTVVLRPVIVGRGNAQRVTWLTTAFPGKGKEMPIVAKPMSDGEAERMIRKMVADAQGRVARPSARDTQRRPSAGDLDSGAARRRPPEATTPKSGIISDVAGSGDGNKISGRDGKGKKPGFLLRREGAPDAAQTTQSRQQLAHDLQQRLKALGLGDKVRLRVVKDIRNGAQGRYWRGLVEIAADSPDGRWTLDHEAVHAMRDMGVFRPPEWKTLERAELDEDFSLLGNISPTPETIPIRLENAKHAREA